MNTQHLEDFEGVSLYEQMPFAWEPAELRDLAVLDHACHDTARALQALAVFEETPREVASDTTHHQNAEMLHLQAKVDVLLSLMGRLISEQTRLPARHFVVLRAHSVEWTGPDIAHAKPGDSGLAVIYPNPLLALPLRLPARIVGSVERSGSRWLQTRFENLSGPAAASLEKLVFRRHRRQIAFSKGTGVYTETGIFKAPKF